MKVRDTEKQIRCVQVICNGEYKNKPIQTMIEVLACEEDDDDEIRNALFDELVTKDNEFFTQDKNGGWVEIEKAVNRSKVNWYGCEFHDECEIDNDEDTKKQYEEQMVKVREIVKKQKRDERNERRREAYYLISKEDRIKNKMNYWWKRYENIVENKERYDKEYFENKTSYALSKVHYWMKKAGYVEDPETMPTGMEGLVIHGINNGTWKAKEKKEVSV